MCRWLVLLSILSVLLRNTIGGVDEWESVGCFNDYDHTALPEHFYSPADLDVDILWPNLKPLVAACSQKAEENNYTFFGIQYHRECWGGVNASLTYNKYGASFNCKVGLDGYGVGRLYTNYVYKVTPVNGNWSEWSDWTMCNVTCGGGLQKRMRTCTNPEPKGGGSPCIGISMETKKCNTDICAVNGSWSDWSEWTVCQVTCGGGQQTRERNCTNPPPQGGGLPCVGLAMESKDCNTNACPVNGSWSDWSEWTVCQVTCGGGQQTRERNCTNPPPQGGGLPCAGLAMESKDCNTNVCPVDGVWSDWSAWSTCSVTCGYGQQRRQRSCSSPSPQHGGKNCSGESTAIKECHPRACPVDGQWGPWNTWSACSVTCKGGQQRRERNCNNPAPQNEGKSCHGVSMATRSCNTNLCPVDGHWGFWNKWSACTVTCNGGRQKRKRNCNNPAPQNGGKICHGVSMATRSCNTNPCPVDGQWGLWNKWRACSVTCKGGQQRRNRNCNNPAPQNGGKSCRGVSMATRSCNTNPCPVNGGWSSWNTWSSCDRTCGGGSERRHRSCTRPPPKYNGRNCVGQGAEARSCNSFSCPAGGRGAILCETRLPPVLYCGLFRRINIVWAHYGYISGESACGHSYTTTCSAPSAFGLIRSWCQGRIKCILYPWNVFYKASCGAPTKYLKVYFTC